MSFTFPHPNPDNYEQSVPNSVALLNAYGPANWIDRINLVTLDMGSTHQCILGQVYGDYYRGKGELADYADIARTLIEDECAFAGGDDVWKRTIEALREQQMGPQEPMVPLSEVKGLLVSTVTGNLREIHDGNTKGYNDFVGQVQALVDKYIPVPQEVTVTLTREQVQNLLQITPKGVPGIEVLRAALA